MSGRYAFWPEGGFQNAKPLCRHRGGSRASACRWPGPRLRRQRPLVRMVNGGAFCLYRTSASASRLPEPLQPAVVSRRSEEHTSELQSPDHLVCRLLLEKKKNSDAVVFAQLLYHSDGHRYEEHVA